MPTRLPLDIMIASDLPEYYSSVGDQPKYPHVWVSIAAGNCAEIRAMFSGANYNSEAVMADFLAKRGAPPACLKLESGTIKGLLAPQLLPVSAEAAANKPRGTIVSLLFPLAGTEHWRVKRFLFE